jgi:hypothetical protein
MKRPLRHAVPIALGVFAAALSGGLVISGVRSRCNLEQKELQRLRARMSELVRDIKKQEIEVAELLSPPRLERAARKLGMVYPRHEQFLRTAPRAVSPGAEEGAAK